MDPAEVRRRNFVPPDMFPFQTKTGALYDSGQYEEAMDKVLAAAKTASPRTFGLTVDGDALTEPVSATYAAGRQAHVPLLAGWNKDENFALGRDAWSSRWLSGRTAAAWAEGFFVLPAKDYLDHAQIYFEANRNSPAA